ncbi:hypothetical protein [Aulosira sp. FACHB-615]|uniref:hypothetical protein n=1 Tax=Aulosira sp. FACHB-615 TaxID=2692777 RepID=UPI001686036E|nr:hypothetical protein [Aulosira sp. FACHB-615]MBD2487279.1 hypothetical protein [Aulosira sp. FACHB-615]
MRLFVCSLLLVISLLFSFTPLVKSATPSSDIEEYLINAQFQEGEAAFTAKLQENNNDDLTRFKLGVVQLMGATQRLTQSLYRYGVQQNFVTQFFPILRLPVPINPKPEPVTYQDTRNVLQNLLNDLTQVKDTLEPIKDNQVKLPLRLGLTRLDINGDGKLVEDESFWKTFSLLTGIPASEKAAQNLAIAFDAGDVIWLRGYCNLLSAIAQIVLAYDESKLFDATAHLIFAQPKTPYPFLVEGRSPSGSFDFDIITDIVAFVHLMNFPVAEPERLTTAMENLRTVTALSRQSWDLILAETDNDREWLPNPQQKGVIPNAVVTKPMIDEWLNFLNETDALLTGQKLVPLWRKREVRGINLNKVFTQPQTFDLVLWVQGTAPAPYLELGKLTDTNTWLRLLEVFRGQFFQFAAWFN